MHGNWSQFIRQQRTNSGLGQSAYARILKVARATLIRWERGDTTPNDPELVKQVGIHSGAGEHAAMVAAGLREPNDRPEPEQGALERLLQNPRNREFWDAMPSLPEHERLELLMRFIRAHEKLEEKLRARGANPQDHAIG